MIGRIEMHAERVVILVLMSVIATVVKAGYPLAWKTSKSQEFRNSQGKKEVWENVFLHVVNTASIVLVARTVC